MNIDIFIAIYTYYPNIERYILTEKILKHYKNIRDKFVDRANITFTIVGSEKSISKELTLKYMNENEYFEFDQTNPIFNNDFWQMLHTKINTGINISKNKNPDILFWAGSNDYICFDFFEQVINYYDQNKKQIYGIDNFFKGNNVCLINQYDFEINKLNLTNAFIWNGVHAQTRIRFNYTGGIIGINKQLYIEHENIFNIWSFDEGIIEEYILNLSNIDKFQSEKIIFLNVKSNKDSDLNPFENFKLYLNNNKINFEDLDDNYKNKINDEILYYNNL